MIILCPNCSQSLASKDSDWSLYEFTCSACSYYCRSRKDGRIVDQCIELGDNFSIYIDENYDCSLYNPEISYGMQSKHSNFKEAVYWAHKQIKYMNF